MSQPVEVPKSADGAPLCGRAVKGEALAGFEDFSPCCQSKGFQCSSWLDCFYENYVPGSVKN